MSFVPFNSHSSSYFHDCNILKFYDMINIEACDFIKNCFNSNTFSVFAERFKLVSESPAYKTRSSSEAYFLFQDIMLQDLEQNQEFVLLLLYGITYKTNTVIMIL